MVRLAEERRVNVHIESWDSRLYAFADGEIHYEPCVRAFEEIFDLAEDKKVSTILFDGRRLTGDLSDLERIDLAVRATEYLRALEIHPAIAVVGAAPTFNGLSILAAQSIGTDVQLFPELQTAHEWLNNSPNLW